MKRGVPPFIGWRRLISAITICVCWLFAPAYCQTPDVSLLLQQTPAKGGAITPTAGVHHFELNSEVTLTAVPKTGYQFLYWLGDVSDPGAASTVVYLDKPKIIIAVFGQTENSTLIAEEGISFGGGGAGGSGLVTTLTNFGQMGGMSSGTGGRAKSPTVVYVKSIEVIPEPATGVLLLLGSLFAFARHGPKDSLRSAKSRPQSNL
ncbi:MAG: PEP-CTERM sorting domain-containing protein [Sedimentisphaerales bacterium]